MEPFENKADLISWMQTWCHSCVNGDYDCSLLVLAWMGRTPVEWVPQDSGGYECNHFEPLPELIDE